MELLETVNIPIPFYITKIINPFLDSKIVIKWREIQLMVKSFKGYCFSSVFLFWCIHLFIYPEIVMQEMYASKTNILIPKLILTYIKLYSLKGGTGQILIEIWKKSLTNIGKLYTHRDLKGGNGAFCSFIYDLWIKGKTNIVRLYILKGGKGVHFH